MSSWRAETFHWQARRERGTSESTFGQIPGKGVDILTEGTGQREARILKWSRCAQMCAEQLEWLKVAEGSPHGSKRVRRASGLEVSLSQSLEEKEL